MPPNSIEQPALRVGLLLRPDRVLNDWEVRVLHFLFEAPRFEVICTFYDGRPSAGTRPSGALAKFKTAFAERRFLKTLLLGLLGKLEDKHRVGLPDLRPSAEDREFVRQELTRLEAVPLTPMRRGWVDRFDEAQAEQVRRYELDVLLRHDFNIIRGPILEAARFGIWSFHHADNRINRGLPAGFWEVYLKQPVTGVTLQELEDELDGGQVIDRGFYSTQTFWYKNNELTLEKSVEILEKNLRLLQQKRALERSSSGIYSERLYRDPSVGQLAQYLSRHIGFQWSKKSRELRKMTGLTDRHGGNYDVWKLHVGRGGFLDAVLWRTTTIEPPAGEFWADPFLWGQGGQTWVFFENFEYPRNKGKISFGRLGETDIDQVGDALDLDYHLSYPFLFERNGELFMMPESCAAKRVEIWRCEAFPDRWQHHLTLLEGEICSDATIVHDLDGQAWLFVNKALDKFNDHTSHLYIYRIDDLDRFDLTPHELNPVVTDSRHARNGGSCFIDGEGRLLRPAQCNRHGIYGESLVLCHIKQLSLSVYEEEIIETIRPHYKEGMLATHHVSILGDTFVIDGCYRKR